MLLLMLLAFSMTLCQSVGQHLVCQSLNDTEKYRGAPGEKGVRGPEGKIGAPGPQGIVDYSLINSTIDKKIQPVISSINGLKESNDLKSELISKIETDVGEFRSELKNLMNENLKQNDEFQSKIHNLNTTSEKIISDLTDLKKSLGDVEELMLMPLRARILKKQGLCDVYYNKSCFWSIGNMPRERYSYTKAESLCRNSGAQVAVIYDLQHYKFVLEYLRLKFVSRWSYAGIWIETRYNRGTKEVISRIGDNAFVEWYPNTLFWSNGENRIYIEVHRDPNSRQGMVTASADMGLHGLLCEI